MENKETKKEYSNGDLTIVWQPGKCIHSGVCVKTLPQVYSPTETPWLKIGNATTEELKAQVAKCPSGALSYFMNNETPSEPEVVATKIEVLKNGPLVVYGTLHVTGADGNVTEKNNRTTFCRCGASAKKPFCDGTHRKIEFKDDVE